MSTLSSFWDHRNGPFWTALRQKILQEPVNPKIPYFRLIIEIDIFFPFLFNDFKTCHSRQLRLFI